VTDRPLYEIADDIAINWPGMYFGAVPYYIAMREMDSISTKYFIDDSPSIVRYFLSNAGSWRGPEARRIKDELRGLLKNV